MPGVMLDAGFVEALGTLRLTPGTVGEATIEEATAPFPINDTFGVDALQAGLTTGVARITVDTGA